jgi:hypothetical protein
MLTSNRRLLIIVLTAVTAVIHFSRAAADPEIRVLFILNGLGYLALLGAYYAPQLSAQHSRVRAVFLGYTAVTILLYLVWVVMSGSWTFPLGPLDKVIEILLIGLLWRDKNEV